MTDTLDELEKLLAEWKQACARIDDPLQKDVIKLKALELALGIESALPGLLAICNAAKTALGHLDDPTGGDEINDMRRASDVLRAALKGT